MNLTPLWGSGLQTGLRPSPNLERDGDGQCWQALVFDPYDPSAVASSISDKRCVSYSGRPIRSYEAATIDRVELVYFARDLSLGASPYAFPADSPVRLVFAMWRFSGVTDDERPLEVLWPAMPATGRITFVTDRSCSWPKLSCSSTALGYPS